ncbi:4685_t:CDS:2, partial [Racocetra fulgida]
NTLSQPGDRGGFQRSLEGSLFGMRSTEHSNPTSSIEFNTLRKAQAETRKSDLVVKIAGPIEFLPSDYQWQDIKIKIPITVGKIIKLDSNKKIATIADYTVSHATSVLTYRHNEGVDSNSGNQTNASHTGGSDKNDLTVNKEGSELTSMSNDPENDSLMASNMEDPEDISWMLDDLEE